MNATQNAVRFASLSLAAAKAVSDATNATRYIDKAIGLFSSLCGRVGAFIAQQRDYSAYCQSESQGIECRTQAPAHNTLTSVAPTLSDADIVPSAVVRPVRKPAAAATPRKRTTRKASKETVAIAANAGQGKKVFEARLARLTLSKRLRTEPINRKDMQAIAKAHGVKANASNETIRREVLAILASQDR